MTCKRPFAESVSSYEGDFNECPKKLRAESGQVNRPGSHCNLVEGMLHNAASNTFLTRFTFCAVPASHYKKNPSTIQVVLRELASDIEFMFNQGVHHNGQVYRCACIGVKGDFEFHGEAGMFSRKYANVGNTNAKRMCPECLAGDEGISFTDMSATPRWVDTVGSEPCWDDGVDPPLHIIPFNVSGPDPCLYRRDPFHMLKFGFARDLAAGVIVHLCELTYFDDDASDGDSQAIPARLDRAHAMLHLWCLAEGKQKSLRRFTKENMKYADRTKLPFLNAKGSDVTLVLTWLGFLLSMWYEKPKQAEDKPLLGAMQQTVQGFLDYFGVLHSHGLFLTRACAATLYRAGSRLLKGYVYLAQESYRNQRPGGFNLRPKLHYYHHSLHELKVAFSDPDRKYFLSHACWNCEANEDHIGKISRISRKVASRTCPLRTLQRYLVKMKAVVRRANVTRG